MAGLLLEDATIDFAGYIAATAGTSDSFLVVSKVNANPEWTSIVLAPGVSHSSSWAIVCS